MVEDDGDERTPCATGEDHERFEVLKQDEFVSISRLLGMLISPRPCFFGSYYSPFVI